MIFVIAVILLGYFSCLYGVHLFGEPADIFSANEHDPFTSGFVPNDAGMPASVAFVDASVSHVFTALNISQIAYSVISRVPIDMVNMVFGPIPRSKQPNHTMG